MARWAGHFFFFKQKTAYEMRISDWSSDVCSSDLGLRPRRLLIFEASGAGPRPTGPGGIRVEQPLDIGRGQHAPFALSQRAELQPADAAAMQRFDVVADRGEHPPHLVVRSEEHTSELQSLMRISYAVFCLKT